MKALSKSWNNAASYTISSIKYGFLLKLMQTFSNTITLVGIFVRENTSQLGISLWWSITVHSKSAINIVPFKLLSATVSLGLSQMNLIRVKSWQYFLNWTMQVRVIVHNFKCPPITLISTGWKLLLNSFDTFIHFHSWRG